MTGLSYSLPTLGRRPRPAAGVLRRNVATVNARQKSGDRRKLLLWPLAGGVIGFVLSTNPFLAPHLSLECGVLAWFADLALALILLAHPILARMGVLVTGMFFAVPCFLWSAPLARAALMCAMGFPFIVAAVPLFAPPTASYRARLEYFFTWMGTRKIERRARSLDAASLLYLLAATVVFGAGLAGVKTAPAVGAWLLVRWFAGGVGVLAFAEMVTASHDILTALVGVKAPSLMRSPFLSTSVADFWSRRWNVAASEFIFRRLCFTPLARQGTALALFAAFLLSAVAHLLLVYMAMGRWPIALACGAFFAVQPLLILAERAVKVRRWPRAAARVWVFVALGLTSPLFVEPAVQIISQYPITTDRLLVPLVAVLGFAMLVNSLFLVGQLAFCVRHAPPQSGLEPTPG